MSFETLGHYWRGDFLAANAFMGLNLVGALLLGMLVGYERSYQGRAAGMRTYGLVCMASTALTVFVGFAPLWYGGSPRQIASGDPTRVVQGVVTGVGFLCAGVHHERRPEHQRPDDRGLHLGRFGYRRAARGRFLCGRAAARALVHAVDVAGCTGSRRNCRAVRRSISPWRFARVFSRSSTICRDWPKRVDIW